MNYSKQREALLEVLRSTKSHPSAYWIYEELKKEFPKISLATVYRNLAQLSARGDILKLDVATGMERYDGTTAAHSHFVCKGCSEITDLNVPKAYEICNDVSEQLGCEVESHSLTFYGLCEKCKLSDKN